MKCLVASESDSAMAEHSARRCGITPGFFTQPMTWDMAFAKFERLAEPYTTPAERRAIADAVSELENTQVSDLMLVAGRQYVVPQGVREELQCLIERSHS